MGVAWGGYGVVLFLCACSRPIGVAPVDMLAFIGSLTL